MQDILLFLLIVAALINALYYFIFYLRVSLHTPTLNKAAQYMPMSIIVAARNEEENLLKNIPELLSLDYPEYEVIVVDDCSKDGTQDVLRAFSKSYSNFKVTRVVENNNFMGGKKIAITLGIKAAKYDTLVFTDADCRPASKNWLYKIAESYAMNKSIVLGIGKYDYEPGLLSKFIRFDTLHIAMQYIGSAISGVPYMGVGRNLSYTKQLYFKSKGFANHMHIKSGDDDLFVNELATSKNVGVAIHPDSFTFSQPKSTFAEWSFQKRRHLTSSPLYKLRDKIFLALQPFSLLVFILLTTLCGITGIWEIAQWVVLGRYLVVLGVTLSVFYKLKEPYLAFYLPIFELILLFLTPIFLVSNLVAKPSKWKI